MQDTVSSQLRQHTTLYAIMWQLPGSYLTGSAFIALEAHIKLHPGQS